MSAQQKPHLSSSLSLAVTQLLDAYRTFLADDSGQDLIEYVLIAALISLLTISGMQGLGTSISSAYTSITTNLTSST